MKGGGGGEGRRGLLFAAFKGKREREKGKRVGSHLETKRHTCSHPPPNLKPGYPGAMWLVPHSYERVTSC